MKKNHFSILPIGGVDEIGSNMTLIRTELEDVIVDCGMLFPYEECFDINYLIPDFSFLDPKRIRSILITHGHEDHIGGLGLFLKKFSNVTVYATDFTLHLIQKKLVEFNIDLNFKIYIPSQTIRFSEIEITPVHVNHSIPETNGIIIRTLDQAWGALYISDFKVDLNSVHEKPIDFPLIKQLLSTCSRSAYFIDSTNILSDSKTNSEGDLHSDLQQIITRPEKRVYITLFASNIHRVNIIAQMALAAGRKLVVMGRSLWTYIEAARETGHFSISADQFHLADQIKGDDSKLLIFLSGCQGDFLSALRRFSFGEDGSFKPRPGDLVVFSSKTIPGNEKKIYRIYNKISKFGAEVITASDYLIHASGHPGKEDLKLLLKNFSPDYYFPIHGETYMLKKHYDFIKSSFPEITPHIIHNFQEVIFKDKSLDIKEHSQLEPVIVHGKHLVLERTQISQRRKLATQGAVFISYHRSKEHFEISLLGLPLMASDLLGQLKLRLTNQINSDLKNRDENYFKDQIKISTRQFFNNFLGYKPVTDVHIF